MNIFSFSFSGNLKLLSRNEGKIKSYKSCADLRAWSHDDRARDSYLREWMKCDMPICVLPLCTLANFFKIITCQSRGKTVPRCHANCKSKALLESLYTSCHAINECLKSNPTFDKYFAEEEFDTSHWPYDKCLDILKNIKMLWKVIVEKVFRVQISKCKEFNTLQNIHVDNVKSVAKLCEKEIVQQALFVKDITPFIGKGLKIKNTTWQELTDDQEPISPSKEGTLLTDKPSKAKSSIYPIVSQKIKTNECGKSFRNYTKHHRPCEKYNKSVSVRLKGIHVACDTTDLKKFDDELNLYKRNVNYLHKKCADQEDVIEQLKRDNNSLKIELNNFYKTDVCVSVGHPLARTQSKCNASTLIPKPFESCIDDINKNLQNTDNTDSEMIISMKNCRNESFKYVSLLQVLHKTNESLLYDETIQSSCRQKDNPIDLLTKVHNTFGEIVKREIRIVTSKQGKRKHDVDVSFCKAKDKSSTTSCSTSCQESE